MQIGYLCMRKCVAIVKLRIISGRETSDLSHELLILRLQGSIMMEFPIIPVVHAASSRISGWLAYLPMLVAEETRLICPNHTHGGS